MTTTTCRRRDFLYRLATAGLAVCSAGTLGAACQTTDAAGIEPRAEPPESNEPEQAESVEQLAQAQDAGSNKADATEADLTCTDTSGLSEQEIKTREALEYTDETPKPDQDCANCRLWKPAEERGTCGGCKIIAGPIHPDGWCTAWITAS